MQHIKTVKLVPMRLNIDTDMDRIPDWRDCQPYNPYMQGRIHDYLEKRKMEKAQEQLETVDTRASMLYLVVKIKDGKWENWGAYTKDSIKKVIEDAKALPNVERVLITQDKKYADKLNRQIMIEQAKKVGKAVGRGAKRAGKAVAGGTAGPFMHVGAPRSKGAREYIRERGFVQNLKESIQPRPTRQLQYYNYPTLQRTPPTNIQIYNTPQPYQQPYYEQRRKREPYYYEEEQQERHQKKDNPFGFYKPPIVRF